MFHIFLVSTSKFDQYIRDAQNGLLILSLQTRANERLNNLCLGYMATSEALTDDDDTDEGNDEGPDGATKAVTEYVEVKLVTLPSNVRQSLTHH